VFAVLGLGCNCALVYAQAGFYGGGSIREQDKAPIGVRFGNLPSTWTRFAAPVGEDSASGALAFGGYRWRNDLAIEAAINTSDKYSDKYSLGSSVSRPSLGLSNVATKMWNVDVYTNWEVLRSVSLYGRLGYAQSESRNLLNPAPLLGGDTTRHARDGVNYGVGVRYDLTDALGLRAEYARFNRLTGEVVNGLPESDQLSIGVQYRF